MKSFGEGGKRREKGRKLDNQWETGSFEEIFREFRTGLG